MYIFLQEINIHISKSLWKIKVILSCDSTHSEMFHDEFIHYCHSKLQECNYCILKLAELTAIDFLPPSI